MDLHYVPGFTPLHLAVQCSHANLDMITYLIHVGANVNKPDGKSGRSALYHAAESGQKGVAQLLLKSGANINFQNYSGSTALHVASACQNSDIVSLLMQHGADTTIKNSNLDTCWMVAKEKKVRGGMKCGSFSDYISTVGMCMIFLIRLSPIIMYDIEMKTQFIGHY